MPAKPPSSAPDIRPVQPGFAWWAIGLVLLPAFLGGATQGWSRGLTVVLIGAALLLTPPLRSLGKLTNVLLVALAIWSALPLLPASWSHAAQAPWRAEIGERVDGVPSTISAQPWLSAEGWLLFVAGLLAFYWFASCPWSEETRRRLLRWFASGLIVFGLCCLLLYLAQYAPPFWHNDRLFGPFPSRNHSGSLLAIGAFLAAICAIRDLHHQRLSAWWFVLGAVTLVVTLVCSLSRGGCVALGASVAAYLGHEAWRRKSWRFAGATLGGSILATVALWFFAGPLSDRLNSATNPEPNQPVGMASQGSLGFRGLVWQDALRMSTAGPWTGVGFGNFEAVFPFHQVASKGPVRLIHPESDWLWLATTVGLGGLLLLGGLVAVSGSQLIPVIREARHPFDLASAAALIGFAAHSLFDVPGHLFGTALPALLLLGTLIGSTPLPPASSAFRLGIRIAGLLLALGGSYLLVADLSKDRFWPGSSGVAHALASSRHHNGAGQYPLAFAEAAHGLRWSPLSWQLYFQQAAAEAALGATEEAQDSFQAARLLQPGRPEVPEAEAAHWLAREPRLAPPAWREALALTRNDKDAAERFARILNLSRSHPDLRPAIVEMARSNPRLFMVFAALEPPSVVAPEIVTSVQQDPKLARFTALERQKLLQRWWQHDPAAAVAFIQSSPAGLEAGWPVVAHDHARRGEFEPAYRLARKRLPPAAYPDLPPGSRDELRRRVAVDGADFGSSYGLARRSEETGDLTQALRVAKSAAERPGAPSWVWSLKAELAARTGAWEEAWHALLRYGDSLPASGLTF